MANPHHVPALVKLWMLRLLTRSPAHVAHLSQQGLTCDSVAAVLGLARTGFGQPEPEELKTLHQQVQAQYQRLSRRNPQPPRRLQENTATLGRLLRLSRAEQQVLQLVTLYQLYPCLDDTVDMVRQQPSFDMLTRQVALLLDTQPGVIARSLQLEGRLVQSGLIMPGRMFQLQHLSDLELPALELPRRMLHDRLAPEDLLAHIVQPAPATELGLADYPHLKLDLDILQPYLRKAMATRRPGINLLLHGLPGTGKTELSRALAATLGASLYELHPLADDLQVRGQDRLQRYQAAQSLLPGRHAMLLIDEAEDILDQSPATFGPQRQGGRSKALLNRALESNRIPTVWITNHIDVLDPALVRRFDAVITMDTLPLAQRRRVAEQYCGHLVPAQTLDGLARIEALTPAVVARAAAVVEAPDQTRSSDERGAMVSHLVRRTLEAQGHTVPPTPAHPATAFDPDCLNTDLDPEELLAGLRQTPSARLCFYGPPGTGKTALAGWLAASLGQPMLVRRASDLLSPYVGGNEQNLARAFAQAQQDEALLVIDEVDSFLQDRAQARNSWEVTGVNELLTQMEQFEGRFIATTNRLDHLDPASLRRFDLKLDFRPLTTEQAERLLDQCRHQLGVQDSLDAAQHRQLRQLEQLTPGDFAAVMRRLRFSRQPDLTALLESLAEECALKAPVSRSIGFV